MLIMGTMIGSGIFVVSAYIMRDVGCSGWLLAVWIATGVMTVIGALSYAELAGMMPHAGGQYIFLREAYSPLPGFLYGWVCFLVIQTGSIAAVAVVFAKFLGVFVPSLGTDAYIFTSERGYEIKLPLPWLEKPFVLLDKDNFSISNGQLVAVGVIVFLTFLNCRGVREGKWVQNIMTLAKVLALGLLIVIGLTIAANAAAVRENLSQPFTGIRQTESFTKVTEMLPGLNGWIVILMVAGSAMTYSMFAADAWNNITFSAGEVQNPRKTLAQSLALGTILVIVLYLLANLAYLVVLPAQGDAQLAKELKEAGEEAKTPEAKAALAQRYLDSSHRLGIAHAHENRVGTAVLQQAAPGLGVFFMAAAIMISTFGCVNGMVLMGARLYYAMARDHLFFSSVGRLNHRGVPAVGLVLQGLWSVLLVFTGSYDELVDFVMFTVVVFYALTVLGLFILRWRQPNADRPYRAFGYPLLPGLYVLACLAISIVLLFVKPEYTWPGLIITVTGIPVYFFWRWRRV